MKPEIRNPKCEVKNSPALMAVFERIAQERERQRQLQREGRFRESADSLVISSPFKLTILTEEVGEVAHEVHEMHDKGDFTPERNARLQQDLVQVAAVACAWLESFETRNTRKTRNELLLSRRSHQAVM